jgi:transposase-like protein
MTEKEQQALALLRAEYSAAHVGRALGVHPNTIRYWRDKAGIAPKPRGRPCDSPEGKSEQYQYRVPEPVQARALSVLAASGLGSVKELMTALADGHVTLTSQSADLERVEVVVDRS